MSYDPIKEARELAVKEEMERAGRPHVIGSHFMLCIWDHYKEQDEKIIINIEQIQTIQPRLSGGTYIYMVGEPDAILVKHSFKDVLAELKQYFK